MSLRTYSEPVEAAVRTSYDADQKLLKLKKLWEESLYWDEDDISESMFRQYALQESKNADNGWLCYGDSDDIKLSAGSKIYAI
ncbi:MAG: hypothetical protein DWQ19_11325 [Crenarchaeota archaeon]|nr:MAG: hypothetical protein DWQ19_11325 [Thermoproteota archaeon]